MKNLYLLFISILFLQITFLAQAPDTLWTHTYNITYIDWGYCVQQTLDGGFVSTGYTENQSGNADIFLLKTDADGNTSWVKTWGTNWGESGEDVKQTLDGGYVIVGGGSYQSSLGVWLLKTDSNGDTLWTKHIGKPGREEWGFSIQQTSDGGYIIAGTTEFWAVGDIWLIKTTGSGDTLWTKTLGGNSYERGYSIGLTDDGGYIITGFTTSFGAGETDLWLVKTDSYGNKQWDKTYGGSGVERGYSVQQTTDGGYIIAGSTSSFGVGLDDSWLIKTNSLGDTLWTRTFGTFDSDGLSSVEQTNDGGYIAAGTMYGDAWLVRTDSDGNTLWTKTIGGIIDDVGEYVQQTSDGGYILVGASSSFSSNHQKDVWLIRIDSDISEVKPSQSPPNKFQLFRNYPNPFNPSTRIRYSVLQNTQVQIKVFDVLGNEITTLINEEKPAGNYEVEIDASSLSSGVYFYQLKAGSFIETKKMILLK